ncbi:hypothetical protein GGS23DRAFT_329214 [Durotheca rogersii]|uniref:uncharacterized protein n=1 Tax=Durotheca rogersii TaxID=419775 RepID=UPI00221E3D34|nr:uncharacterized protein GGS23DRAFT_329214 [Durotheca rogersii]KAI5859301.1 hypothetical protein GGS23DRAFT_329214 [Durotheca rogersii]
MPDIHPRRSASPIGLEHQFGLNVQRSPSIAHLHLPTISRIRSPLGSSILITWNINVLSPCDIATTQPVAHLFPGSGRLPRPGSCGSWLAGQKDSVCHLGPAQYASIVTIPPGLTPSGCVMHATHAASYLTHLTRGSACPRLHRQAGGATSWYLPRDCYFKGCCNKLIPRQGSWQRGAVIHNGNARANEEITTIPMPVEEESLSRIVDFPPSKVKTRYRGRREYNHKL